MATPLANRADSSQPALYEPTAETSMQYRDLAYAGRLFSGIRSHWRLFIGVFVGFVVLVTVATLLVPKQYTATVKMIVGGVQTQDEADAKYSSLPVLNALALQNSTESSDTVAELVQEGPVLDKVIDTLKLNMGPDQLLSHVSVKPVLNTAVLSLSVTWRNRERAALVANVFSQAFVERERTLIGSQAVAAQGYLREAITNAQNSLQQANGALASYQAKFQIADITSQTQALLQNLESKESKIDELTDDEKQAQAQLASAQSLLSSTPATVPGQQTTDVNPATTQLRQQLADAEVQLATARQRYTDKNPTVITLKQQVDQLARQLAAEPATVSGGTVDVPNPVYQQLSQQSATLQGQIQGDAAQIKELTAQRKALAPAIAALPAQTAKLGFLQERAKLASDVYTALEQKYDDAVVAANSAISDVTVVQPASAQEAIPSPNLLFNMLASVVIGLILAVLAVVVKDALERHVREDKDVERTMGLPVIAHIPNMTAKDVRALPWLQTVTAEAFLHLCASLRILGQKSNVRVVAVTSPRKGEGKTTVAYQLACAMSRIRRSVLLIDADMRCPAAHKQAQIENARGLSDVLSGSATFEESVVEFTPTFHILTAGRPPQNPVGLIEANGFDDVLRRAREQYECVIVDTPALSPVVDAALIAARADATAIVLSTNESHEGEARTAATRLRSLGVDNVIGVILNRTKTKFSDYSDYFASEPRSLAPPAPAGSGV